MSIKVKIIRLQLESLRSILYFLLKYKKPTNRIVIFCSQQLDEVIVKYQKFYSEKSQNLQCISADKALDSQICTNTNKAISYTLCLSILLLFLILLNHHIIIKQTPYCFSKFTHVEKIYDTNFFP